MGDLENVAPAITHHRPAIPVRRVEWLLHDHGPGRDSPVTGKVGVIDVDVEEGRESLAFAGLAYHDKRVTYPHLGRASLLQLASGAEDSLEESGHAGNIRDDHSRRHRVVTGRRLSRCHPVSIANAG
jgi:hypothetical protein